MDDVDVLECADRRLKVGFPGAVRGEDQAGVGADAALLHRLDRDPVLAELVGDLRQHAGAVGDFHEQVELRLDLVHRPDPPAAERADRRTLPAGREVLRRVDEVAEDGGC